VLSIRIRSKFCFSLFKGEKIMGRLMNYTGYVFLILCVSGCAALRSGKAPKTAANIQTAPSVMPFQPPPIPEEGSLWTNSSQMLFSDNKARQVGDTVIVDIIENTSSSMDVNTETSRDSSIDAGISDFMGVMRHYKARNPNLDVNDKLIGATVANSFKGAGTSDRKGQVTASIAARVTEVLPNRHIVIYGRREMKVNNETQYITVSGLVRQEDIDSFNHVQSTYIADSRIEYSGRGVLADKQKVGWLTRIFDNIWPF
jgi:flagellar L-ring protein FlgH